MKNLMVISLEEARGIDVENVAGTILETEKFYPNERRPKGNLYIFERIAKGHMCNNGAGQPHYRYHTH